MPPYGGNKPRQRPEKPKQTLGEKLGLLVVVVGIAGLAVAVISWGSSLREVFTPGPEDRTADVQFIAPFTSVVTVEGAGWVGTLPLTWEGRENPAAVRSACEQAYRALGGGSGKTLALMAGETPLYECGDGVPGGGR